MKTLTLCFCINLSYFLSAFIQTSAITINSYNIEVALSESSQAADVKVICDISKTDDFGSVQFLLNSKSKIHSVTYLKNDSWLEIPFSFNGKDSLLLITDEHFIESNNYKLKFEYLFPLDEMNDTLIILDRGHRWYPLIGNQIFTYMMKCEVPESYSVLSSGNLIEETDSGNSVFIYECDKPVLKMPLIVFKRGYFQNVELLSDENKLEYYSQEPDSTTINRILNQADSILSYFSTKIGPYSREELIYFEVSDFGGINVGSGLLTIGSQSIEMINKGYKDMLILTIAQQWFGANVFADFSEPGFFFFTISLPHYLKLMYIKDNAGEAAFNNALLKPLDSYKEFAGNESDIPIINVDMPNTREKGLILYAKGPYVLNIIAQEMGIETWKLFLMDIYKTFSGKIMSLDDFENYINEYDTSGKSLALFKKLINEKGLPKE
ncbi:MAG TPA: hypothetical protein VLH59_01260 [Ignavibacteriaceae bacterium]|nr:hypothetical protein [Ignavibacteriaceae bacterium]